MAHRYCFLIVTLPFALDYYSYLSWISKLMFKEFTCPISPTLKWLKISVRKLYLWAISSLIPVSVNKTLLGHSYICLVTYSCLFLCMQWHITLKSTSQQRPYGSCHDSFYISMQLGNKPQFRSILF